MDTSTLLCELNICRLCACETKNGTDIFTSGENTTDLTGLINRYLPLKIEKDGKFPRFICPGCNIQLEATKLFFDLIIEGQAKLRGFLLSQNETLKRKEKQRAQLESALQVVNPNTSIQEYEIQTDNFGGEQFLIQIVSNGPLFPPEHELSLRTEGLEKPKRKRGRPPKPPPIEEDQTNKVGELQKLERDEEEKQNEEEGEVDADGRRKRRIKVPSRYSEVFKGKELDRVFKEEGVIDEDSFSEEEDKNKEINAPNDEIIGHLQNKDGEDTGQLIVINRNTNRYRIKNNKVSKKRSKYECEICGRLFQHLGRLEMHKSFHKHLKYKCASENCIILSENKKIVEEHQHKSGHFGIIIIESLENYGQIEKTASEQQTQDNKKENEPQVIDNKIETTINRIQKDFKDEKFQCTKCEKYFSCKQNYEIHCKAVHENQKIFQCDKCDKSFSYLNTLKGHELRHSDKNYPCEICEKIFHHPSSLVYHREAEHNNGRRFVCNKCKKTFKHKQLLLRHQLVHSDIRPHTCEYCDASFKTRANLLNHMPTHTGEKKYVCPICMQSFAHKTSLTLHIRWHNGQKPYQCDVCKKLFSQKGNLAEHQRIHTGEKPYCCDLCGRKFTTSSQFKLHMKRHTGERPWRCEYCTKAFMNKETWKCHIRRHKNERPFQCKQCFRSFTEQWALRKHERLHTGEKPYQCDVCKRYFADSSNLTKHKKIHLNSKLIKQVKIEEEQSINDTTAEGNNQIVYLTLQENPQTDGQTNLIEMMGPLDQSYNKPVISTITDPNNLNQVIFPNIPVKEETEEISLNHLQIQQVTDTEGNPISLTTPDGQSIKIVTANAEGQQNVHGLLPDGTLIPINLSMQDKKQDEISFNIEKADSQFQKSEKGEGLNNSSIDQFLDGSNLQFLEDGQNVCFVTAYNVDDTINQQYLM